MRRPIAAAVAVAALWLASPASALTPRPYTDLTPRASKLILCPAELGGGAGLAWLRFGETAAGRDVFDLGAAGIDPPTATAQLQRIGGCPSTASTPAGATLIAVNRTGFSDEYGSVFAFDRAASGATGPAIALSDSDRAQVARAALASSGAALVAWTETPESATEEVTTINASARDAGGAFQRLGPIARIAKPGVSSLAAGIDDAGYGIVAWTQTTVSSADDKLVRGLMYATRAPGAPFTAPRAVAGEKGSGDVGLVVGRTGEILLAVADGDGVRVASGTTRTGLGAARKLATANSSNVTAVLTASGTAAVAWTQGRDEEGTRDGVVVSDRPAGGDFGAPHALVAPGSRRTNDASGNLRLAAAADGRVLATWAAVVSSGDGVVSRVPFAALRRTDGTWEQTVRLAGTCREPMDAFPGFDAAGQPRAVLVDSGFISAGDYGFWSDTRVRLVRMGGPPATPAPPPKVTITAARRQVLRDGAVRLRVRCERACDAVVLAVIRGQSGPDSGLFPKWERLRAGRGRRVSLYHESYFDDTGGALDAEGRTVKVRLVVHACDSAGRRARARRTISVRIPRTRG